MQCKSLVAAVNIRHFNVAKKSKILVSEASDLREHNLKQPLYDDAADAGFALWNPATNAVTRWAFAEEVRDNEGDLLVTYYSPTPETLRKFPQLNGWTIHILND